LNQRFSLAYPFSFGGKYSVIFGTGITELSNVTGEQFFSILSQLPYMIFDGPASKEGLIPGNIRQYVLEALVSLLEFQLLVCNCDKLWRESDIVELELHLIPRIEVTWSRVFRALNPSRLNYLKFHEIRHFPRLIRLYGNPMNWDTGTMESFHRPIVKKTYPQFRGTPSEIAKRSLELTECLRVHSIRQTESRRDQAQEKRLKRRDLFISKDSEDGFWFEYGNWMTLQEFQDKFGETEARFLSDLIQSLSGENELESSLQRSSSLKFTTSVAIKSTLEDDSIGTMRCSPDFRRKMRYDFVKIREDTGVPWYARLRAVVKDFELMGPALAIVETLEVIPMEQLDGMYRTLNCQVLNNDPDTVSTHVTELGCIEAKVKVVPDYSSQSESGSTEFLRLFVDRFDKLSLRAMQKEDSDNELDV
jgi:hypothetical protein